MSINHSGLIGRSWAMLFAAANYKVVMYDLEESQLTGALTYIRFVFFFKCHFIFFILVTAIML